MSNLKVNTINDASGGNAAKLYGVSMRDGGTGWVNRIINGDMRISQRGTSFSVGGSDIYTVDRWFALAAGANITATKVSYADGTAALALDGAASNTLADVGQRIESVNSYDLAGVVCTVALDVFSNDARNVTWEVYYANSANVFSSKTLISSGTLTTVANTYTPRTFQFTAPSGAANGLEVRYKFGSLLAGKQVAISRIQLEAGTVATPFERRDYGRELMMCQRYFQRTPAFFGVTGGSVQTNVTGAYSMFVPMRASPTASIPSGCSFHRPEIAFYTVTGLGGVQASDGSGYTTVTIAAGAGTTTSGQVNGGLFLSAEL